MKTGHTQGSAFHPGRHRQIYDDAMHDPYLDAHKPAGTAVCDGCGAAYREGAWHWEVRASDAAITSCPACRRVRDKRPAGYVTVAGRFLVEHHDDLVNLIRRVEAREKAEHPLKRIMAIRVENNTLLIETTDAHLARGIGEALERAYKGDLRFHYNKGDQILRVEWAR
ncbi:BCAM0308 family protein [Noviherbaspirillum agri]